MSISPCQLRRHLRYNLAGTVFLVLFGAVYERFSHGVYSWFMLCAFAIPLLLGVIPYTLLLIQSRDPGRAAVTAWSSGIAALSFGSVLQGVLEIYGTTNALIAVYPIMGGTLLIVGALFALPSMRKTNLEK